MATIIYEKKRAFYMLTNYKHLYKYETSQLHVFVKSDFLKLNGCLIFVHFSLKGLCIKGCMVCWFQDSCVCFLKCGV